MDKSEILHKEIDLIQECIKRMAHNSFMIKGWMLSVAGIVLAIAFKNDSTSIYPATWIISVIILCFWILDAYFLRLERMFIALYNWVISSRMESEEFLYDLNPRRFENETDTTFSVMFSPSLWIYYCIPLFVILIVNLIHFIP